MIANQKMYLNVDEIRSFSKTQPEHHAMLLLFSADALELSLRFTQFDTMVLYQDSVTVLHLDPQSHKDRPELSSEGNVIDKNGNHVDWGLITQIWDEAWDRRLSKLSSEGLVSWKNMFEINAVLEISKSADSEKTFEDLLLILWENAGAPELLFKLHEFHLRGRSGTVKPSSRTAKI